MLSRPYIHTTPLHMFGKRQRAIVVVAPADTVSDRLKAGLERELPWATLVEVGAVSQACCMFHETVSLILLHPNALAEAEKSEAQLRRYHPLALIGLLHPPSANGADARASLATSKMLQGLVPLGSKVHDFVAIVSFMLRGGEYFPRDMLLADKPAPTPVARIEEPEHEISPAMSHLTRREREILELVARGLQNKSIAASLNLSEFTVKIHLHNIITKLGAHNRTEAAAFYRNDQSAPSPGLPA